MEAKGKIFLVGAGPGDPDLITLKAIKALNQADVVIYDRLASRQILSHADHGAELIYVGKASGQHALSQDEINALLVAKAGEGKTVVRLKGGDPFLFGRGGEEALFVREHGYDFEIIPGVTSAIACPAYAGIPVTHRDVASSFTVITGHEKPGKKESSINWKVLGGDTGTLVFLMGIENLEFICDQLIKNGKKPSTPVALVRWGTLPHQQVITGTLQDISERSRSAGIRPPAVIVVGEVVKLREKLAWLEKKPLWGKTIIVTRARAQASILVEKINELGGEAVEFPTINIVPEVDLRALYTAFKNLPRYDWIIFTSVNGVDIFFNELIHKDYDIRNLQGINICAIGPATRDRLAQRGIKVDYMPNEYMAEGIIEGLGQRLSKGQWVLLPRARGARSILPESLRSQGIHVNTIDLYRAEAVQDMSRDILEQIMDGEPDYITFTSSSTVANFVKIIGPDRIPLLSPKTKIACIGPITAKTAEDYGLSVEILAPEYTIDGLVKAILEDSRGGMGK
ncbi:MAG: uroporphyrinogen-III C-methyltransferase [Syntrophomonadaceae bacterium]|jgi:uroporphyrinogen III methyltransferase/synthase